ncbi:MAG TPA: 1-deoxy-D-xylulose-5-phosphate reductoisomerase [Dehalococcoidia bacterium]|nr:1-deoxy-D-xylulose-5-phosphate reductoisomerase [Dehalococcoidia bacterium]
MVGPLKPSRVAVLGSTGSIGRQTLDVIRAHPDRFQVVGLAAGKNTEALARQVAEFRPAMVCCADGDALRAHLEALPGSIKPPERVSLSAMAAAPEADIVVSAIVGAEGLQPTLAALSAGKPVALANKEAMVMAGHLVSAAAAKGGGEVRPVDSEHSAIWQCLAGHDRAAVRRLIITASGGALRDLAPDELQAVTPARALEHPTWLMGRRITIDSATLFNKGLEVIEAHWLFGIPFERIDVLMHRESIVHSLVEMNDGSLMAQLSMPDMRLPIQYALTYPERLSLDLPRLDLARLGSLTFAEADMERYPCLGLALAAGRQGGTAPAALAAADEEAVEAFLDERLPFVDIPRLLADTLERHTPVAVPCLEEVLEADAAARRFARRWIASRK